MRIAVTVTYEYDVVPEHYDEDERTPSEMASFDLNHDPLAQIDAVIDTIKIEAVEVGG